MKSKGFPLHNPVVPRILLIVTNHLPTRPPDHFIHVIQLLFWHSLIAMISTTYGRAGNSESLDIICSRLDLSMSANASPMRGKQETTEVYDKSLIVDQKPKM